MYHQINGREISLRSNIGKKNLKLEKLLFAWSAPSQESKDCIWHVPFYVVKLFRARLYGGFGQPDLVGSVFVHDKELGDL